jgi:predicted RNase H-like nuclease
MFVGLDGYPKGWVAVWLDEHRQPEITFLHSIRELFDRPFDRAMIDIPIGLPDLGYRACDIEAQRYLGQNRSRVFTGARRPLLSHRKREDAHAWAKATDGKGVSCQLFCLMEKIRQVDNAMTHESQTKLRETHPELAFQRLNGGCLLPKKKTPEGVEARRQILSKNGFTSIDCLLAKRVGKGAKADDVLDACVCALVAKHMSAVHRLPKKPQEPDSRGLKMEIWF